MFKTIVLIFEACCLCALVTLLASILAARRGSSNHLETTTRSLLTADYSADTETPGQSPALQALAPSIAAAAAEDEIRLAKTELRIGASHDGLTTSGQPIAVPTAAPRQTTTIATTPVAPATRSASSTVVENRPAVNVTITPEPLLELRPIYCSLASLQRSVTSSTPTQITFANHLPQTIYINWIDLFGEVQPRGSVPSGQERTYETFVTHPWVVTDSDGSCLAVYLPSSNPGLATLR